MGTDPGFLKFIRVVGEVACTGSHCWVLSENNFTIEFNSKVVPEVRF
jgi:hypothetical protein